MKYCKKCLTPDTRPRIVFHDGVCNACLYAEKLKKSDQINYFQRGRELENLVERIKKFSNINELPYESIQYIKDCKIWIVDALRWQPHPTHFHVDKVLELVSDLNVESAILTNMHIDLDYKQLCEYLPKNIVPAYDGMII